MKVKDQNVSEPAWLDPRNDRKTPYTDAELAGFADDFIAGMSDTLAWQELVAEFGAPQARQVLVQRLTAQDPKSLINWHPNGPMN